MPKLTLRIIDIPDHFRLLPSHGVNFLAVRHPFDFNFSIVHGFLQELLPLHLVVKQSQLDNLVVDGHSQL